METLLYKRSVVARISRVLLVALVSFTATLSFAERDDLSIVDVPAAENFIEDFIRSAQQINVDNLDEELEFLVVEHLYMTALIATLPKDIVEMITEPQIKSFTHKLLSIITLQIASHLKTRKIEKVIFFTEAADILDNRTMIIFSNLSTKKKHYPAKWTIVKIENRYKFFNIEVRGTNLMRDHKEDYDDFFEKHGVDQQAFKGLLKNMDLIIKCWEEDDPRICKGRSADSPRGREGRER